MTNMNSWSPYGTEMCPARAAGIGEPIGGLYNCPLGVDPTDTSEINEMNYGYYQGLCSRESRSNDHKPLK